MVVEEVTMGDEEALTEDHIEVVAVEALTKVAEVGVVTPLTIMNPDTLEVVLADTIPVETEWRITKKLIAL